MRRNSYVSVIVATLAVFLLAGCSGEEADGSPGPSSAPLVGPTTAPSVDHEADAAALARVTLTGNLGSMPFFTVEQPLSLTGEVARIADEGSGRAVEPGHAVAAHVASFNAKTDMIIDSSYEQGPELLLAAEGSLPPALYETMVGARVGSRVLFGTPADGVTMIYSFEILATEAPFERAQGTAETPAGDLPTITLADNGEPALTPVNGDPPSGLVAQPLITGIGDPISADSWLVVNYRTWLWDGTDVVSTWSDGHPTVMRLTDAIVGWQEGLIGQTLGSQVMLVVPPDKAFGAEATQRVPAGSTVVFVIDILAGM